MAFFDLLCKRNTKYFLLTRLSEKSFKKYFISKIYKTSLTKIDYILCQSSDDRKGLFTLVQIIFKLQEVLNLIKL